MRITRGFSQACMDGSATEAVLAVLLRAHILTGSKGVQPGDPEALRVNRNEA